MANKLDDSVLGIVIVNWNGRNFLKDCMEALRAQTWQHFTVFFVDNASNDDSVTLINEFYNDTIIIQNDDNYGFAKANNIGIKQALSHSNIKYILTLNNDTMASPDFLKNIMAAATSAPKNIGSFQGKVVMAHDPRLLDAVGIEMYQNGVAAQIGYREIDDGQYQSTEVWGVNAAAAIYRRTFIESISYKNKFFDEEFFAYLEDVDVAFRGVSAGWKAQYVSDAVIAHIGSATSGIESPFKWRLTSRNRLLLTFKNYRLKEIVKYFIPSAKAEIRLVLGFLLQHQAQIFWTFVWARISAVILLPRFLSKRLSILSRRKVKNVFADGRPKLPPASGKTPLSVIIPNWNGKRDLSECLQSLRSQSLSNIQIIVVDNGSSDGSVAYLAQYHPEVVIIPLNRNKGFAGGVNEGIGASTGTYVALLNNDAVADKKWAEELVGSMKDADIVASCILQYEDKNKVDSLGEYLSRWGLPYPDGRNNQYSALPKGKLIDIFAASGGASIYRRTLLEDIGVLDAQFFAYLEDVDLSLRAKLVGARIALNPDAIVYHKIGATSSKLGHFARYQLMKNSFILLIKNLPASILLPILPRFLIIQILLFGAAVKNGAFLVALQAWGTVFISLPIILIKRRKVQKAKTVPNSLIHSWLTKKWPLNRNPLKL